MVGSPSCQAQEDTERVDCYGVFLPGDVMMLVELGGNHFIKVQVDWIKNMEIRIKCMITCLITSSERRIA
jgi:hypothetical protein